MGKSSKSSNSQATAPPPKPKKPKKSVPPDSPSEAVELSEHEVAALMYPPDATKWRNLTPENLSRISKFVSILYSLNIPRDKYLLPDVKHLSLPFFEPKVNKLDPGFEKLKKMFCESAVVAVKMPSPLFLYKDTNSDEVEREKASKAALDRIKDTEEGAEAMLAEIARLESQIELNKSLITACKGLNTEDSEKRENVLSKERNMKQLSHKLTVATKDIVAHMRLKGQITEKGEKLLNVLAKEKKWWRRMEKNMDASTIHLLVNQTGLFRVGKDDSLIFNIVD